MADGEYRTCDPDRRVDWSQQENRSRRRSRLRNTLLLFVSSKNSECQTRAGSSSSERRQRTAGSECVWSGVCDQVCVVRCVWSSSSRPSTMCSCCFLIKRAASLKPAFILKALLISAKTNRMCRIQLLKCDFFCRLSESFVTLK